MRDRRSWSPPTPACAAARSFPTSSWSTRRCGWPGTRRARSSSSTAGSIPGRRASPAATSTTRPSPPSTPARRCPAPGSKPREPSYILYTSGHDRQAEGRAARYRRLRGRARRFDARHLLPGAGGDDAHHQRHRLGRRPLLHRLRAADQRLDDDALRGPADPPRPRHLVADRRRLQGAHDVQLAHRDPRAQEAGSGVHEEVRPVLPALSVSGRRAARRADRALGLRIARRADRRSLLADRKRLADPVGATGHRGYAAQVRQPVVPGVRLRRQAAARGDRARRSASTRRACWRSCRRCRRDA